MFILKDFEEILEALRDGAQKLKNVGILELLNQKETKAEPDIKNSFPSLKGS